MMSQLMNINVDAIIAINQNQCMVYVNRGTENMFGYSAQDLIGQPLDMILPTRFRGRHDKHIEMFANSAETSRAMGDRREIMGLRCDGSEFPAQAGISKIHKNGEQIFMVILQDISERVALEEKARESSIKSAILDERNRLSRELHDTVTQTLFTTTVLANVLPQVWEKNPAQGKEQLDQIRKLTHNALSEMRMLMMELRPNSLGDTSLKELLQHLQNAATNRTNVKIALDLQEQGKLPPEVHVAVYRILQETLINLVRLLDCKQIDLNLFVNSAKAILHIHLDGKPLKLIPSDVELGANADVTNTPTEAARVLRMIYDHANNIGATVSVEHGDDDGSNLSEDIIGSDIFIEWSKPR